MAKSKAAVDVDTIEDEVLEEIASEDATEADEAPRPKGRFAALYEEAMKDYVEAEPYPFDWDPDNVVYVTKPDDTERALALAAIIDTAGNVDLDRVQPMLYSLLGDAFGPIWRVISKMPIEVTIALVQDIQDYFFPEVDTAAVKKLPGGTAGSSS